MQHRFTGARNKAAHLQGCQGQTSGCRSAQSLPGWCRCCLRLRMRQQCPALCLPRRPRGWLDWPLCHPCWWLLLLRGWQWRLRQQG